MHVALLELGLVAVGGAAQCARPWPRRPRRGSRSGRPGPLAAPRRRERRGGDRGAHRLGAEPAAAGDRRDDLLGERVREPLQRLALGVAHRLAQQRVRRVLVLVPGVDLRLDAEPVQRAPQERRAGRAPTSASPPDGCSHTSSKCDGQVVGERAVARLAEGLGPADRPLAGGLERLDGRAELLDLRAESGRPGRRARSGPPTARRSRRPAAAAR